MDSFRQALQNNEKLFFKFLSHFSNELIFLEIIVTLGLCKFNIDNI